MNKTLCLVLLTAFAGASIFASTGGGASGQGGSKVKPRTTQAQPQQSK